MASDLDAAPTVTHNRPRTRPRHSLRSPAPREVTMRHRPVTPLLVALLVLALARATVAQTPAAPPKAAPAAPAPKAGAAAPAPAPPAVKLAKDQTLRMVIREP